MEVWAVTCRSSDVVEANKEMLAELSRRSGLPVLIRIPGDKRWLVAGNEEQKRHFERQNESRNARRLPVVRS